MSMTHPTFSFRLQAGEEQQFVRWRGKAGAVGAGGQWEPGESGGRTGEYGRYHLAEPGGARTVCARDVPEDAYASESFSAPLHQVCRACLRLVVTPYLS